MKIVHVMVFMVSILGLPGCGGSSGSGSAAVATPATPALTGVLTDSAVGGVSYTTSGGYSSVTGTSGQYNYNSGETITFKIGTITLGAVAGAESITPIQLAGSGATATNKVVNLLILLQSLDTDGNPANGISVNAATIAAASTAGTLDFTVAPASFGANATLISLMTSSGLPSSTPVTAAVAKTHFKSEFFKQLKGTWKYAATGKTITFVFGDNGSYTHTETGDPEGGGFAGTEVGVFDWDPETGRLISKSISSDTNGRWGATDINNADDHAFARILDATLFISDRDVKGRRFTRIP